MLAFDLLFFYRIMYQKMNWRIGVQDQPMGSDQETLRIELDRARDREAATREVLQVISQCRNNEIPVFRAILDRAERLCGAEGSSMQLLNETGTHLRMLVLLGEDEGSFPPGTEFDLNGPAGMCVAVREARVVHIEDLKDTELYKQGHEARRKLVDVEGRRTHLNVPLIRGGMAFGNITLGRNEVKPFTPDQIALVETFAAQAVIAIENVRQFREVQTRLEREKATSEILSVISLSRDDVRPVFDVVLEMAARLSGAPFACLFLANPERTHLAIPAYYGTRSKFVDLINDDPLPLDPSQALTAQAIVEKRPIQIADFSDTPIYRAGQPQRVHAVEVEGVRTVLAVPLLGGDEAIGVIFLYRREVALFKEDEIALVQTFAQQAVIAIENVQQFKALETLNAELGDRVEEQVGKIEQMGRLKRFLPTAVADTVMSSGSDDLLKSHRVMLGVLMCDIRGFTAFVESAEPEETIEVLQNYHEEMGKLINASGAGVDQRVGDGLMVLFNDPVPCDDPAGQAVRLAIAMRKRMAELCATWKKLGHRLGFGVGISLGYATVGIVGFEGRIDYSASGTAINLAARLCDDARDGEVLLSPRARTAVENDFQVELRDEITFKGIREPVEVFKLTDAAEV